MASINGIVAGGGGIAPPKFWVVKNCRKFLFTAGRFSLKNAKFGAENPNLGKIWAGKIKILSTHNLLCRKFEHVCGKTVNSCPAYFFNPRRRCRAQQRTVLSSFQESRPASREYRDASSYVCQCHRKILPRTLCSLRLSATVSAREENGKSCVTL